MSPDRRLDKVCVLFGGASSERLVSSASAQNILENLPEADAWFLSPQEKVFFCERSSVLTHRNPFTEEYVPQSPPRFTSVDEMLSSPELKDTVFFLSLHGLGVEDGTLQAKMESAHVAFTGSGSRASVLAFNKSASKKVAAQHGVRVARSVELSPHDPQLTRRILQENIKQFGRVAAKPTADGSSMGLYILDSHSDLDPVVHRLTQDQRPYLIEEFIVGTELTVGVLEENGAAHALPPSEVRLNQGANFDYNAKYLGQGAEELTPARVSPEITRAAQNLALTMHQALGCQGYSRTDLIVSGNGPVFLETNTLPGMTKASFFPQQLVADGKTLDAFLRKEVFRARNQKRRSD